MKDGQTKNKHCDIYIIYFIININIYNYLCSEKIIFAR
jgi:hypothetical protein